MALAQPLEGREQDLGRLVRNQPADEDDHAVPGQAQPLPRRAAAVEAADGIGVHLYWSNYHPMKRTLSVLDDYISRFRNHAIWITEASHNQGTVKPEQMAHEYLTFWKEILKFISEH